MKETECDLLTKERKQEINLAVNRLMKIKRIRTRKRLINWLKDHRN